MFDDGEAVRRLGAMTGQAVDEAQAVEVVAQAEGLARLHGSPAWVTRAGTPEGVRVLVLRAAARYLQNTMGLTQSTAGEESLTWGGGEWAGQVIFTRSERDLLADMAGVRRGGGVWSVGVRPW